ncbi:MAG TPA: hypothetical protein VLH60_06235 [Sedimentisphaerales bacterium]|nr:hypothetical protein [Sedimentisphaerales bacterium]
MSKGLVMIAAYDIEILAAHVQQYFVDNDIEAFVFAGGLIMKVPCYEVHVPAEKAEKAKELLKEFEAERQMADEDDADWEVPEDSPERTDCEGGVD